MRFGFGFGLNSYAYVMAGGIPPDSQGAIGDVALDTATQVWYEKRWVANREGAGDSILFPINLFPSAGDFDFSVRVRIDSGTPGVQFINSSPTLNRNAAFFLGAGVVGTQLFDSAGTIQRQDYPTIYPTIGVWTKLQATRTGNDLRFYRDGVSYSPSTFAGWTPSTTQTGTIALRANSGNGDPIKCCDLRLTGPGGSIIAPLNEGTGTTITNQAGANGTLTDGSPTNFWYAAWVPMDVPSMDFRIPDNSQYIGAIL